MPLDPALFRKDGGQIAQLKASQRARFQPEVVIDEITEIDAQWRAAMFETDNKKAELNKTHKVIAAAIKNKQDTATIIAHVKDLEQDITGLEKKTSLLRIERDTRIRAVGNFFHASVTVSQDEEQNAVVRQHGECTRPLGGKERHHHELLHMIDGYEHESATRMAGHRAFFLKGAGVLLNQALIGYSLSFLLKKNECKEKKERKNWVLLQPPFFMNEDVMAETAQLSDFAETLYRIVDKVVVDKDGKAHEDSKFLIATSEQPISALHRHELIKAERLPLRYCGLSTCFRKEAGAHGKDAWGIFRVHQFEKIEQFCITSPNGNDSWEMHEEMIRNCEEFYESLGLPYRVVSIVSGALNDAASKKYDLEAWFPTLGVFRELVSASNCTDYQSRALQIKFGGKKGAEARVPYVHMLNATLCATERTMCCILENNQTDDGIRVPPVLVPFMGGITFMPFKNPPPINKQARQHAGQQKNTLAQKPQVNDRKADQPNAKNASGQQTASETQTIANNRDHTKHQSKQTLGDGAAPAAAAATSTRPPAAPPAAAATSTRLPAAPPTAAAASARPPAAPPAAAAASTGQPAVPTAAAAAEFNRPASVNREMHATL